MRRIIEASSIVAAVWSRQYCNANRQRYVGGVLCGRTGVSAEEEEALPLYVQLDHVPSDFIKIRVLANTLACLLAFDFLHACLLVLGTPRFVFGLCRLENGGAARKQRRRA